MEADAESSGEDKPGNNTSPTSRPDTTSKRRSELRPPKWLEWLALVATVVAGAVAVIALGPQLIALLLQASQATSEESARATIVVIETRQLGVQSEIATALASDIRTGPAATASAERVVLLASTLEALNAEGTRVATAAGVTPPNISATTIVEKATIGNMVVELVKVHRFQNTLTIDFQLINSSVISQPVKWMIASSYLRDDLTQRTIYPVDQSTKYSDEVPPNGKPLNAWAKYRLSADENPGYLTLVLGDEQKTRLDHITIPTPAPAP